MAKPLVTNRSSNLPKEVQDAQRKLEQQRLELGIFPPPQLAPVVELSPVVTLPSSKKIEKVVLIRELEAEHRFDLGCLARPLVRCQIPMTDPKSLPNPRCYERTDGDRRTKLVATSERYSLPYGGDLVTIYGLCTKGRELYRSLRGDWDGTISFPSTADMLRYFGDPATKYYYNLRMSSLLRIWHCRFEIEDTMRRLAHKGAIPKKLTPITFLGPVTLWFQLEDRQLGMPFKNIIQFSPEMIQQIKTAPLFEDQKIFWLKKAVGALQLYLLLRDRCAQEDLKGKEHGWIPVHGSNSLESQLGWVGKPAARNVRDRVNQWIQLLKETIWPDCPAELVKGQDNNWRLKISYIAPVRRP